MTSGLGFYNYVSRFAKVCAVPFLWLFFQTFQFLIDAVARLFHWSTGCVRVPITAVDLMFPDGFHEVYWRMLRPQGTRRVPKLLSAMQQFLTIDANDIQK